MEEFFDLEQTDAAELESNFVQLGYESSYFLSNLGTLLLIIIFESFYIIMVILLHCSPIKSHKLKQWSAKKFDSVFFNVILTTIDGTLFVTLLMAMINIKQHGEGVIDYNSSFVYSVLAVTIIAAELVSITIFLAVYYKHLDVNPRLKRRCGYIF